VKKYDKDANLFNSDILSNKGIELDKIKTTNVNILLNRVREGKKRTLKKRILFSLFMCVLVSCLSAYFII